MNAPIDDTQRELEQRALRNVRGLVDKVENQDLADKRAGRRVLAGLAVAAIVFAAICAVFFTSISGKDSGKTVTIEQKR